MFCAEPENLYGFCFDMGTGGTWISGLLNQHSEFMNAPHLQEVTWFENSHHTEPFHYDGIKINILTNESDIPPDVFGKKCAFKILPRHAFKGLSNLLKNDLISENLKSKLSIIVVTYGQNNLKAILDRRKFIDSIRDSEMAADDLLDYDNDYRNIPKIANQMSNLVIEQCQEKNIPCYVVTTDILFGDIVEYHKLCAFVNISPDDQLYLDEVRQSYDLIWKKFTNESWKKIKKVVDTQ